MAQVRLDASPLRIPVAAQKRVKSFRSSGKYLEKCRVEEAELLALGWKRSPGELDLPKARPIEEESD